MHQLSGIIMVLYIITTNMHNEIPNTNFIITAKDPAGPWSEPYVIENAPGIDPDLFFDDNGKCILLEHTNLEI